MASYAATQVLNKTVFPVYKGAVDLRKRPYDLGATQNAPPAGSANPVRALEFFRGKNRFAPYNHSGIRYMQALAQREKLMLSWELYARLHLREWYKNNGYAELKNNGDGTASYRRPQYQFYAEPARLNMLDDGVDPYTNNEEAIFDLSKRLGKKVAGKNQQDPSLATGLPKAPSQVSQPAPQALAPPVSQIAPTQSSTAPPPTNIQQGVAQQPATPALRQNVIDQFEENEPSPLGDLFDLEDVNENTPFPTNGSMEPQIQDATALKTVGQAIHGTPPERVIPDREMFEMFDGVLENFMQHVHEQNKQIAREIALEMVETSMKLPGVEPSTTENGPGGVSDPTTAGLPVGEEDGSMPRMTATPIGKGTAPQTPDESPRMKKARESAERKQQRLDDLVLKTRKSAAEQLEIKTLTAQISAEKDLYEKLSKTRSGLVILPPTVTGPSRKTRRTPKKASTST